MSLPEATTPQPYFPSLGRLQRALGGAAFIHFNHAANRLADLGVQVPVINVVPGLLIEKVDILWHIREELAMRLEHEERIRPREGIGGSEEVSRWFKDLRK